MGGARAAFRDIARRREQVLDARKTWMQRATDNDARFARDEKAWRAAVDEALLSGQEPPPPLDVATYNTPGDLWTFKTELERLDAEETRIYAAHAAELRAELDAEAAKIWQRIAPIVRELDRAAEQLEQLRQEHRRIDNATGSAASVWRSQPITADMLLDSSASDGALPQAPTVDRSHAPGRRRDQQTPPPPYLSVDLSEAMG